MKCLDAARVILFLIVVCIVMGVTACSFPAAKPSEGLWYCEELQIEIDFNHVMENQWSAKKYDSSGKYKTVRCLFDYGTLIRIDAANEPEAECYLEGNFLYKNDIFSVTTNEGITYTFERTDVTQT